MLNLTYGLTIGLMIVHSVKSTQIDDESIWIDLSFYIGAIIGTVFLTIYSDVFGRKRTLIALIIPQGVIFRSFFIVFRLLCSKFNFHSLVGS